MPRITLPSAAGSLFDSSDPATSGQARVYWLGALAASESTQLADALLGCETLLHVVAAVAPQASENHPSWVLDPAGELGRAFGATGPLAIMVDSGGRVAMVLPAPTVDSVAALAMHLFTASAPTVVKAKAPVLLLERVMEPALRQTLMEYWRGGDQVANRVGAATGNVINEDIKRRIDVQVDDPSLFVEVRDCLARRVVPAILQAFHTRINVIEAPIVGCYDADAGGKFHRHRDNTSSHNAHRQFALSLNLNADDEYDGGEVRFAEFGRELYRPVAGGALVFSGSLLHEVIPVTRGRRFGLFTFLSTTGPAVARAPSAGLPRGPSNGPYAATPRLRR